MNPIMNHNDHNDRENEFSFSFQEIKYTYFVQTFLIGEENIKKTFYFFII